MFQSQFSPTFNPFQRVFKPHQPYLECAKGALLPTISEEKSYGKPAKIHHFPHVSRIFSTFLKIFSIVFHPFFRRFPDFPDNSPIFPQKIDHNFFGAEEVLNHRGQDIFTKLDINHNGALTRSELVKMPVARINSCWRVGWFIQLVGFREK